MDDLLLLALVLVSLLCGFVWVAVFFFHREEMRKRRELIARVRVRKRPINVNEL